MALDALHETDLRRIRIWALQEALQAHGCASQVAESGPLLVVSAAFRSRVSVRCDHRAICGGEMWFFFPGGEAITPADDEHMADTVAAIKGKVEVRM